MHKGDIRPAGFNCPRIKVLLRFDARYARVTLAASLLASALISFLIGFRGGPLLGATLLFYIPIYLGAAVARAHFRPSLVVHKRKHDFIQLHIAGPRDSSKDS